MFTVCNAVGWTKDERRIRLSVLNANPLDYFAAYGQMDAASFQERKWLTINDHQLRLVGRFWLPARLAEPALKSKKPVWILKSEGLKFLAQKNRFFEA